MRGSVVFLWAAIATVVLLVAGIFGTLIVSGRIDLFPADTSAAQPPSAVTPVVDTSATVIVLNASGQQGLATQAKETLVQAGWTAESVLPGEAGSPFELTTVYYSQPEDEAAALGLADVIGGAEIAQSAAYDAYPVEDDPNTEINEVEARRLVVVIGTDRATGAPVS